MPLNQTKPNGISVLYVLFNAEMMYKLSTLNFMARIKPI